MKQISITGDSEKQLAFVVHKHDATRLHYDFRLQVGNVMPSWAIPKGPSLDNKVKRLAMETMDHSMEYRKYEGILPEGSYGAGPVMIWDEGYYLPEIELAKGVRETIDDTKKGNKIMREGLKKGEVKFQLFGKKLRGSFALIKTRGFGPKNSWLLIKHHDAYVKEGYDSDDYKESAFSGRTIEEIRESLTH